MYTTFETEIAIRPDDIDLNNHVHNTKYLEYVFAARYIQMRDGYKMSMQKFWERELNWVISITHIEYKRSIKLEDKIIVRTQIDSVNGAQAKVLFFILNKETNKVAAEGYLLYTMISTKSGRPVRIPDDIIEMYSK